MSGRISVGRAIAIGMAWVNGPVILLLFVPTWSFGKLVESGIVGPQPKGVGLAILLAGFVLAWTWWSFSVPRWRVWAYERVTDLRKLKEEAVSWGLTWREGGWFAKTEIKSAALARREAELDATFEVVPASDADIPFAHDLARDNMARTFAAAGIAWDPTLIPATWGETENHLVRANGQRIGILRLRPDGDALYVSDLQVAAEHRNRGAGTFALRFAGERAIERDLGKLRLRVFAGSKALSLYRREGFVLVADEGTKLLMEQSLES